MTINQIELLITILGVFLALLAFIVALVHLRHDGWSLGFRLSWRGTRLALQRRGSNTVFDPENPSQQSKSLLEYTHRDGPPHALKLDVAAKLFVRFGTGTGVRQSCLVSAVLRLARNHLAAKLSTELRSAKPILITAPSLGPSAWHD